MIKKYNVICYEDKIAYKINKEPLTLDEAKEMYNTHTFYGKINVENTKHRINWAELSVTRNNIEIKIKEVENE